MALDFNIISAGPSRAYLKASDLLQHTEEQPVATCTVNRALDVVERGIEVDFAAFVDGPQRIWDGMDYKRFWKPGMILWIALHAIDAWENATTASQAFKPLPMGQVPYGVSTFNRNIFSALSVLEKCYTYKPNRVRIICADMVGSWALGKTEEECERQQGCVANFNTKLGLLVTEEIRMKREGKTVPKALKQDIAVTRKDRDKAVALGETHFKRWEHEKRHLLLSAERAKKDFGCVTEFCTPRETVVA